MRSLAATAAFLALLASPSLAQETQPEGWQTWTWKGECFALLYPTDGAIQELNKPKAYMSIKHKPSEQTRDAIAIVSGLEETEGLSGQADINGQVFPLLVFSGSGFVKTGDPETAMLAAMQTGDDMRVTWTSSKGMVVQTYDIAGMAQAKRSIDGSCYPTSP